ncbi:MAG: DsbA family protein [bacterium]|nr:DsbA family protein [bacterium]
MTEETKKEGFSLSTPVAIIIAGLFIAGAVVYANQNPQAPSVSGEEQSLSARETQKLLTVRDNDYILGNPDAPVTFFEFGDFECPFCAKFHQEARKDLMEKYVSTGQVRVIWRHFPLISIHPLAEPMSEAAECAGEQGKFWEYHDGIYESPVLTAQLLLTLAQNLGLNMEQFTSCLESGKYAQKVADDFDLGQRVNVSGTPTFFINGEQIVGAVPFASIEPFILKALK